MSVDPFWEEVEAHHAEPGFVLLTGGDRSFAAWDPVEVVRFHGAEGTVTTGDRVERVHGDPFTVLAARTRPGPGGRPFHRGWMGWFGYEAGRRLELGDRSARTPDVLVGWYDHVRSTVTPRAWPPAPPSATERATAETSRDAWIAAVLRIQEWIRAGDVYQVNLTQRFTAPFGDRDPWAAFGALMTTNPAPFSAYLHFPDAIVLSSSPERFVEVRDGVVTTRPIKGTAARGTTPEDDARRLAALLASEKDLAELTMIVDLLRNDLGRVCRAGSVRVLGFPEPETFASVHHLVATIRGELDPGRTVYDLLRAALPGGSITGAPKIRAMQLVDRLEPGPRGVYTGCIGYVAADGDADLNIAIRTAVVEGGTLHVQGGGGITIDSDPAAEHEEALLKVRRVLAAFGLRP